MGTGTETKAEPVTCPFCKGNGRCAKCDGSGSRLVKRGFFGLLHESSCRACEGTGECQLCHGVATLAPIRTRSV